MLSKSMTVIKEESDRWKGGKRTDNSGIHTKTTEILEVKKKKRMM